MTSDEKKQEEEIILSSKLSYTIPPSEATISSLLLDSLKKHRDRTLLVGARNGVQYNGSQVLDKGGRLASAMRKRLGLHKNDVIFFVTDHNISETLLVVACQLAGVAVCGTSVFVYEELVPIAELSKPKVIACSPETHKVALRLATGKHYANAKIIVAALDDNELPSSWKESLAQSNVKPEDHFTLNELLESQFDSELIERVVRDEIKPDDLSVVMQTSGSTGPPKLVPQEHRFLVNDIFSIIDASRQSPIPGSSNLPLYPLDKDDTLAGDLPLDQGAGVVTMFWSLFEGSKLVIMDAFRTEYFWQTVDKYRITASVCSAGFAYKLFSYLKSRIQSEKSDGLDLTCFRYIATVGSKMSFVDLIDQVRAVYTHIKVCQYYGATEIGYICMLPIEDSKDHLKAAGYLVPDVCAKVIDINTGKTVGPNQDGELLVKSASLFHTYVILDASQLPELMERTFTKDGFYHTGDLVHYDEQGRIYVHGRIKETLSFSDDWKVMPADIEAVINEHPLVESSAVIGVPDPEQPNSDVAKAFVKLYPLESAQIKDLETKSEMRDLVERLKAKDHKFLEKHIYDFEASVTAEQKWLRGGVRILAEFPKVGYFGKIDKKALKLMP